MNYSKAGRHLESILFNNVGQKLKNETTFNNIHIYRTCKKHLTNFEYHTFTGCPQILQPDKIPTSLPLTSINNILHSEKIPTSSSGNHKRHLEFGRYFESILFNNTGHTPSFNTVERQRYTSYGFWPSAHLRRTTKLLKDSIVYRLSVCMYRETVGELNCLQGCYLQTVC